jgi:putative membrane protein
VELFDTVDAPDSLKNIDNKKHVPNQVAALLFSQTNQLYKQSIISGEQLIILNAELQSFTDISGACERIKNTPIPFSYSIFLKKFIFFYIMSLPFGLAFTLGFYTIPVVAFIFYVLASLELIAEEIEDPFGGDANDVPIEKIAKNIHKNVIDLIPII